MVLAGLAGGLQARLPQLIADIETLVRCESPSADLAAVAACADLVTGVGTPILGAGLGGGAHADDEHVVVSALPARAALIADLI
jgi:acetylornithine deacetylase/succinyl-diaminopimelate desuccinylase-like protein